VLVGDRRVGFDFLFGIDTPAVGFSKLEFGELEPCENSAAPDPVTATGGVGRTGAAPLSLMSAASSPRWARVTACCGRGAQGDVVASGRLDDSPDRVHKRPPVGRSSQRDRLVER
jgi:hypothetical protein